MFNFYSDTDIDIDFPCDTNINGKCISLKNVNDCVDICKQNNNCKWGIYKNNLCYPIDSTLYPNTNPLLFIKPKKGSNVFVKKDSLTNINTNIISYWDNIKIRDMTNNILFNGVFTLIPNFPYVNQKMNTYPISINDYVVILESDYNRILQPQPTKTDWIKYLPIKDFDFQLIPNNHNNILQHLHYSDNFIIKSRTNGYLYNITPNNTLSNLLLSNEPKTIFKFEKI